MQSPLPVVLTFAGADPTSGAGLQADILTLVSMGCHPLSVVTAITVQDTARVDDFLVMDGEWVSDQARMVLEDMPVAAFKVGMLGSVENVAVVAEIVSDYPDIPLILDPVLASGGGDELSTEDMVGALRELLIPQATLITPNSTEARRLLQGDSEDDDKGLAECAEALRQLGCEYVLITGTHENTPNVINTLYGRGGKIRQDSWLRLPGSYHGSGCTLASAIAACIATGMEVPEAVREAQEYTWQTLQHGYRAGMGQMILIPDRMFWARQGDEDEEAEDEAADSDASPPVPGAV